MSTQGIRVALNAERRSASHLLPDRQRLPPTATGDQPKQQAPSGFGINASDRRSVRRDQLGPAEVHQQRDSRQRDSARLYPRDEGGRGGSMAKRPGADAVRGRHRLGTVSDQVSLVEGED